MLVRDCLINGMAGEVDWMLSHVWGVMWQITQLGWGNALQGLASPRYRQDTQVCCKVYLLLTFQESWFRFLIRTWELIQGLLVRILVYQQYGYVWLAVAKMLYSNIWIWLSFVYLPKFQVPANSCMFSCFLASCWGMGYPPCECIRRICLAELLVVITRPFFLGDMTWTKKNHD